MPALNLGILAAGSAGETSLSEGPLYVAPGPTHSLERPRGITIKGPTRRSSADDKIVDLIDTIRHPDCFAEVEWVLHVLDGVVQVLAAVEEKGFS